MKTYSNGMSIILLRFNLIIKKIEKWVYYFLLILLNQLIEVVNLILKFFLFLFFFIQILPYLFYNIYYFELSFTKYLNSVLVYRLIKATFYTNQLKNSFLIFNTKKIIFKLFSCFMEILLPLFFLIFYILLVFSLVLIIPLRIYFTFLSGLLLVLPLLLSVAYMTVLERKILAGMQRRTGPNVVGFYGLLQAFADALKLIVKEPVYPYKADFKLFLFAPLVTFFLSLSVWAVFPLSRNIVVVDLDLAILYVFAISSLSVYGIIIAGWSSNSKYAFLGAMRSSAQMISYEVSLGIILMSVLAFTNTLNISLNVLSQEFIWFFIPFLPSFVLFFISSLAETSRVPFDLPEAESELVSGYNVEYSSIGFVLFFIAEYANIIFMSSLNAVLFFGGWVAIKGMFFLSVLVLLIKILFFLFLFIWIRAVLPRYRYDQLMYLGWKIFLPISLGFFFLYTVYAIFTFSFFSFVG